MVGDVEGSSFSMYSGQLRNVIEPPLGTGTVDDGAAVVPVLPFAVVPDPPAAVVVLAAVVVDEPPHAASSAGLTARPPSVIAPRLRNRRRLSSASSFGSI